jgi:hypothetical protein
VQSVVEFAGRVSRRRLLHKALAGVQQRPIGGEPNAAVRPKATRIKLAQRSQRVILAPMRRVPCARSSIWPPLSEPSPG